MTLYKNFIVDFGFRIQKYPPPPCTNFEQDQANILANMQVSTLFYSAPHSKQKVAMATMKINENCDYVQNDPHRCKIKLEKFHFHILCCFGVIMESLPGRGWNPPPPGEIGLKIGRFKIHSIISIYLIILLKHILV